MRWINISAEDLIQMADKPIHANVAADTFDIRVVWIE